MSSTKLPTRKIGTDSVTAIGWGAMGLSAYYGSTASDEERLKVGLYLDHRPLTFVDANDSIRPLSAVS